MLFRTRKLVFSPLLHAVLLIASLACGLVQPAYCESQQRVVFYAYIKDLYYATKLRQVTKYWIKNSRSNWEDLQGEEARQKLLKLKGGYVYNAKIHSEVVDGNVCTMKGTGIAQSGGVRCKAQLDVIMQFEEGSWKIQYYTWRGEVPGGY